MTKNRNEKGLSYYLSLKYPVEVTEQAEGGYFVRIPDLPGCLSQGETVAEAMAAISEAKHLWLEVAVDSGQEIPEPDEGSDYSGKFVLRVPRSLHESLARAAEREDVSLNQYVLAVLSAGHTVRQIESRAGAIASLVTRSRGTAASARPGGHRRASASRVPAFNIVPEGGEERDGASFVAKDAKPGRSRGK